MIDKLNRYVPRAAARILYALFFIPAFVILDFVILLLYPATEPTSNDLFTYIRVRQCSELMYEAVPQIILQSYIVYRIELSGMPADIDPETGEERPPMVDRYLILGSVCLSAYSMFTYTQKIRMYARIHTDGNVMEYVNAMRDLGMGLAPTSLVTDAQRSTAVTVTFARLSPKAMDEIALAVMGSKTLERLHFRETTIGDEVVEQVKKMLSCTTLVDVTIETCTLTAEPLIDLLSEVEEQTTETRALAVTVYGQTITKEFVPTVRGYLRNTLAGTKTTDSSAVVIAGFLRETTYVEELSLADNYFADDGAYVMWFVLG
jgi:hypothetical protein